MASPWARDWRPWPALWAWPEVWSVPGPEPLWWSVPPAGERPRCCAGPTLWRCRAHCALCHRGLTDRLLGRAGSGRPPRSRCPPHPSAASHRRTSANSRCHRPARCCGLTRDLRPTHLDKALRPSAVHRTAPRAPTAAVRKATGPAAAPTGTCVAASAVEGTTTKSTVKRTAKRCRGRMGVLTRGGSGDGPSSGVCRLRRST